VWLAEEEAERLREMDAEKQMELFE